MSDRPWGQTLGALGLRQLTGELTLLGDDGKSYQIAFERGAVVGATSPLASDSAVRIALTSHLITSTQVPTITRLVGSQPDRDEVDVLAETVQLDPEGALRLRQRVIAQRAARTFSVESGNFVIHDTASIPTEIAAAVDVRAVVYLGVRMNLSEQRLLADLRGLGSQFTLRAEAEADLAQFGMTASERPILEALRRGTTLPELEAKYRDVDPRSMQSVIYALVSCFACDASHPPGSPLASGSAPTFRPITTPPPAEDGISIRRTPRGATDPPNAWVAVGTPTNPQPQVPRTPTPPEAPFLPRTDTLRSSRAYEDPTPRIDPSRTRTPSDSPGRLADQAVTFSATRPATMPPPNEQRTPTPTNTLPPRTHTLTGAPPPRPQTLPPRTQTLTSPPLRPPTTTQPPLTGSARGTGTMPPRTTTPTSPPAVSRTPSEPKLSRTQTPIPARTSDTHPLPKIDPQFVGEESTNNKVMDPLALAADHYKRGQSYLRDDRVPEAIEELTRAADLNPSEFDYHATLAWAQFCGSEDRQRIADKVRKMLTHAIQKSNHPELARFYLARMERMLGRDREALHHFREVIEVQPRNTEAAAEIRQLEARLAAEAQRGGLFGRKKDKDK